LQRPRRPFALTPAEYRLLAAQASARAGGDRSKRLLEARGLVTVDAARLTIGERGLVTAGPLFLSDAPPPLTPGLRLDLKTGYDGRFRCELRLPGGASALLDEAQLARMGRASASHVVFS